MNRVPLQSSQNAPAYRLKVTLDHIAPPIWRRFEVRGDITLSLLHRVLQAVMGWSESHKYKFEIAGIDYGPPNEADWGMRNDRKARLDKVAGTPGTTFTYHYDFGDGWEHNVVVEAILAGGPGAALPVCLVGEQACPPEDCGGRSGYERFLSAVRGRARRQHDALLEHSARSFDPDAFDLEETNRRLSLVT